MPPSTACRPEFMKSTENAAENVIPLTRRFSRRDKDELAFLPAALEIVETPPSPIGRAIGLTIITLFCLALAWAAFGKIDIVASAPGKIITSGRTKTIQPFETGVVRAIHVRDGMSVKAGDVLIELDTTMNMAERNHVESDLTAAQLDIARLRAVLSDAEDPSGNFHPPEGASPQLVAMARQFLINQVAEHRAKVAALDKQRAQKEAERATTAATITKLESTLPVVQQRVDIRGALYNREFGSKLQYLETLQLLIEQQQDLGVQKSKLQESEAAVAAIIQTRAQTVAEFRRTLLDELNKAEAKASGLVQDVAKAEQRAKFQTLTAPVDGVVQQLAVHTIGGVVTPAQALLVLVPQESQLEIEAMVSNRDIGFVHPGQNGRDQGRYLHLHPLRSPPRQRAQRLARCHHAGQTAGESQREGSAWRRQHQQRAQRPGALLCRAGLARPHPDADRRQSGQSRPRHGGHCRDQDRRAQRAQLSALPHHALQAREPARALKPISTVCRRVLIGSLIRCLGRNCALTADRGRTIPGGPCRALIDARAHPQRIQRLDHILADYATDTATRLAVKAHRAWPKPCRYRFQFALVSTAMTPIKLSMRS